MMKRALSVLVGLYIAAALVGHLREHSGQISCGCAEDCWCKRPEFNLFRWAFPFGHRPR